MKFKITIAVAALFFGSLAAISFADSPYPPWLSNLTGDVSISPSGQVSLSAGSISASALASESVTAAKIDAPSGSEEGHFVQKYAQFLFVPATDGTATGAYNLGVALPAKAVITDSYFKALSAFSSTGTLALSCEDANNIFVAAAVNTLSANQFMQGVSNGTSPTFVRGIGSSCNITATLAQTSQTDGGLIGWVHYLIEP